MSINICNIIKFSWQYRHTISGATKGLPPFPETWKDSRLVRTWFQGILESPLCVGFVTDYPGEWDDKLRLDLLVLTNQPVIWDTIWSFFDQIDNDNIPIPIPTPDRITLRERLSKLLRFRKDHYISTDTLLSTQSITEALQESVSDVYTPLSKEEPEDILTIISIMSLVINLVRFIRERKNKESI